MKVNIYETVEISDEQRVTLANVLDQKVNKPKRQATRDEIKAFVWEQGSGWDRSLADEAANLAADTGTEPEPDDLVGAAHLNDPDGDNPDDEDLI